MIINFHEHPGAYAVSNCKKMGIDKAVLLSVGNGALDEAIRMSEADPERFIPFYWVDNTRDVTQEPGRLRQAVQAHAIRGVKFQPMDQHWFPDDPQIYPIYEVCVELGLICTWHAGIVKLGQKHELGVPMLARYVNPLPLDRVAFDFPELRICIAHMGGNFHYEALILAEKHEHIHLDTAFLTFFCPRFFPPARPEALIEHAVSVLGADKILYGSEGLSPDTIRNCNLTHEEQQKILGKNAMRILGLASSSCP